MSDDLTQQLDQPTSFVESPRFHRLAKAFWIVYVLFPIFTGLFWYHWLPNESFDPRAHEVVESHEECRYEGIQCDDVIDVWQDRSTKRIFSHEQFAAHRKAEAVRFGVSLFGYGLIGCFVFAYVAYVRSKKEPSAFYEAFGKAVCVDLGIATLGFMHIL